ncbi:MAG: HD domain-containing protein, partial [Acidimicrobiia bacterium]|nr:HD domain-containing protein [Acidimicrobiia bacterium]
AEFDLEDMVGDIGDMTLIIHDSALYRDRGLLPHASLEFEGMMREMEKRAIESVTLLSPTSRDDIYDFGAFIAGISDDLPADGTVRLNERTFSDMELDNSPLANLRRSYASSVDAVRTATRSLARGEGFEINTVVRAVESLTDSAMASPGAALLLSTVKSHDEYTYFHSVNTSILALALGRIVGLDKNDLLPIGMGSLLHDIGKVAVPPETLQHPGRLDDEQWREIQLHPQEGAQAIMAAQGPGHELAATIAFEHHARFDGKGYPAVSRERQPHVFSRLVAVCDTYDAITTRRSYRRAETPNRALRVLLTGMGGHYDPDLVRVFIKMMGVYPTGSILRNTSGEMLMVAPHEGGQADELPGFLVRTSGGELLEVPEPKPIVMDGVVEQVLPADAGFDPAAYLEYAA